MVANFSEEMVFHKLLIFINTAVRTSTLVHDMRDYEAILVHSYTQPFVGRLFNFSNIYGNI
jgi:hypothetical protein